MRITTAFRGSETVLDKDGSELLIGRPKPGVKIDVDLTPDESVSRPHARIWCADGTWWIEDRGSTRGTKVNGEQIKGQGKRPLTADDTVSIGHTTLRLDLPASGPDVAVEAVLDHADHDIVAARHADASLVGQLAFLCDLPALCAQHEQLDAMLQHVVEQLRRVFPAAAHGALLIRDERSAELLLKAHVPPGRPSVSLRLAERAIDQRQALLWRRQEDPSVSLNEVAHCGMYAPLIWKDEALGALSVDATEVAASFGDDELRLLAAIARHLAAEIAQARLHSRIREKSALLERLLTNFSPAVRDRLVQKAQHGKLRLGGERSEVTLLCSDIRGFTKLSEGMEAEEVVDMLNAYFGPLVQVIFARGGTVDKFVGDAILAVFGSPEPDERSDMHAVQAAVEMQAAADEVTRGRKERRLPACEIGIGIHRGIVLHGFIGSEDRMEFTVIGDAVNRTARFCDAAEPRTVLISPAVHQRVWRAVSAEPVDVPTKHEGVQRAYRVTAIKA